MQTRSASSSQKPSDMGSVVPKFLRALYDMLHYEDPAILAWSHDGTFFQVFDIHRLEQEVLAKYFKHSKFTSLQRQLNNFGFRKWTKTRANVCTFSHDVLRQCHPEQLPAMVHDSEKIMAARASYFQNASAKRTRPECEDQALLTGGTKRLYIEPHPVEAAYDDAEPEAAPPCMGAPDTPQCLLDGFKETDLCSLDWSLLADQTREDDLLVLIDPLMNEQPPAPVAPANEPQYDLSPESTLPTDAEKLVESGWWMALLDKMVTDC